MPSGGTRCTSDAKHDASDDRKRCPPQLGRIVHATPTTTMKPRLSKSPGMMPARYSLGTEVLVSTA